MIHCCKRRPTYLKRPKLYLSQITPSLQQQKMTQTSSLQLHPVEKHPGSVNWTRMKWKTKWWTSIKAWSSRVGKFRISLLQNAEIEPTGERGRVAKSKTMPPKIWVMRLTKIRIATLGQSVKVFKIRNETIPFPWKRPRLMKNLNQRLRISLSTEVMQKPTRKMKRTKQERTEKQNLGTTSLCQTQGLRSTSRMSS